MSGCRNLHRTHTSPMRQRTETRGTCPSNVIVMRRCAVDDPGYTFGRMRGGPSTVGTLALPLPPSFERFPMRGYLMRGAGAGLAVMLFTLGSVCELQAQTPRILASSPPLKTCGAMSCTIDMYDPRYFIRVLEIVAGDRPFVVHDGQDARAEARRVRVNDDTSGVARRRFTREIGLRNALSIRFDRAFLDSIIVKEGFAATIMIRGEYIRQGKAEKLEVPGYSEVGQTARRTRIAALPQMTRLLRHAILELMAQQSSLRARAASLDTALAKADSVSVKELATLRTLVASGTRALNDIRANEKRLLDSYEALLQRRVAPPSADSAAPLPPDSLRSVSDTLRKLSAARARVDAEVTRASDSMSRLVKETSRQQFEEEQTLANASRYLDAGPELLALTDRITGRADSSLHEVTARLLDRDAASLSALGQHLHRSFADLAAITTTLPQPVGAARSEAIRRVAYISSLIEEDLVRVAAYDASQLFDGTGDVLISQLVLQEFAEPTVALPATPVDAGDVVRIIISTTPLDHQTTREFSVHVRVTEFGFNRRVRDVSALVRRRGVRIRDNEARIEAFVNARKAGELFVNDPVTYQPTIGVMLGWQWVPRQTSGLHSFVRWLAPSVGIHVSTPQFGARVYRYQSDSGDVKIEERKNAADIGIGGAIGFWDDRVLLSLGKAVTAVERKSFFAVGFSFVSLVNGALSLNRSAQ